MGATGGAGAGGWRDALEALIEVTGDANPAVRKAVIEALSSRRWSTNAGPSPFPDPPPPRPRDPNGGVRATSGGVVEEVGLGGKSIY